MIKFFYENIYFLSILFILFFTRIIIYKLELINEEYLIIVDHIYNYTLLCLGIVHLSLNLEHNESLDEKTRTKQLNKRIIPSNSKLNLRTQLKFNYTENIWKLVEEWALENNYTFIKSSFETKIYQKKIILTGAEMLKIQHSNSIVIMEVWCSYGTISNYITGVKEVGIESGDLRFIQPRKKARKNINKLLLMLEEPIIL